MISDLFRCGPGRDCTRRQQRLFQRRPRVIVCVQCSGGHGSCLPRVFAGACHAAVVISRQSVKVGKHYILVDRTVHEESRVRGVPADAADKLCGPGHETSEQACITALMMSLIQSTGLGFVSSWRPSVSPKSPSHSRASSSGPITDYQYKLRLLRGEEIISPGTPRTEHKE